MKRVLICTVGLALAAVAEPLPPLPEGSFTYCVIPDTQLYRGAGAHVKPGKQPQTGPTRNPAFTSRVNWIAENVAKERIFFVSHVGDIVDVKNEAQWNFASNLMTRLDDLVPYGISPGNHDLAGEDSRDFNRYFPRERYLGKAWYAGGFDGCPGLKPGSVVSGGNANSCQLAEAGGVKFVFLHLECNAPAPVLKWADMMLAKYADRRAIICTHMAVGFRTRQIDMDRRQLKDQVPPEEWFGVMDWTKCHGANGISAEEAWRTCFSKHRNLILIVSGDQGPAIAARETRKGIAGNTVHLTLQDYPRKADSDDWLRLYRFHGDMRAIDVITYSPRQNLVCEKAGHRKRRDCHVFTLPLDP